MKKEVVKYIYVNFASNVFNIHNLLTFKLYHYGKKNAIENVNLLQKKEFTLITKKKGDELERMLEAISQCDKRMAVGYEERKEFLTPFIRMLHNQKEKHELRGTRHLVQLLNNLARFEDSNSREGYLSLKSLETELYNLNKKLFPKLSK